MKFQYLFFILAFVAFSSSTPVAVEPAANEDVLNQLLSNIGSRIPADVPAVSDEIESEEGVDEQPAADEPYKDYLEALWPMAALTDAVGDNEGYTRSKRAPTFWKHWKHFGHGKHHVHKYSARYRPYYYNRRYYY